MHEVYILVREQTAYGENTHRKECAVISGLNELINSLRKKLREGDLFLAGWSGMA